MDAKLSYYKTKESTKNTDISLSDYIGYVKTGVNQDLVLKARVILQKHGKGKEYDAIKANSMCVMGSCTIKDNQSKVEKNIDKMNGFIVIDFDDNQIDDDKYRKIRNDKYTHIIHRSFSGGNNYCVFIKIDPERFRDSFDGLGQYYFDNFDLTVDASCKNKNRLRFISYDPDIFVNEKSSKFIPKNVKKTQAPKPKELNFIYHQDDFENIMMQIHDRQINLLQEDYFRYVRVGMGLANHFGIDGLDRFDYICSFGSKYNAERTEKDYKGFVKNSTGECTIATFYYYCKQAGISLYTERTKTIINRVKIAKTQGTPTVESIASNVQVANNIIVDEYDREFIQSLINSNIDYAKEANTDLTEIEQIQNFIIDTYEPTIDDITNVQFVHQTKRMTDNEVNDIYLNCKKSFDFAVPIQDIRAILKSSAVRRVNKLSDFLMKNKSDPKGIIEEYINCVYPQSEYNVWAFKKWLVGALHNWTATSDEQLVCPLTLVLTGRQQGTGKTSFIRNILPKELRSYLIEDKINNTGDSLYRLSSSLIILDDEFGGKAFKDDKEYKAISDKDWITTRRPYAREDETFKRRAILCGTSNKEDILKDVTGNRRILPINVERTDYEKMLSINKTDLIIEAYNLLKSGFEWVIQSKEDIEYIKINSQQNEMVLPIEEIFFNFYSLEKNDTFSVEVIVNQGEIWEHLLKNSLSKPTRYDIKEVTEKNNLDYKNHKKLDGSQKKGYKLYMKMGDNFPVSTLSSSKDEEDPF